MRLFPFLVLAPLFLAACHSDPTPQAGLRRYFDAEASADARAIRACLTIDPDHRVKADHVAELQAAIIGFDAAVASRFPGQDPGLFAEGFTPEALARDRAGLEQAKVIIDGKLANIMYSKPAPSHAPETPRTIQVDWYMKKIWGRWKVDLAYEPTDLTPAQAAYPPRLGTGETPSTWLYYQHAQIPMLRSVTRDLKAGKFTSIEQVKAAMKEREVSHQDVAREIQNLPVNRPRSGVRP